MTQEAYSKAINEKLDRIIALLESAFTKEGLKVSGNGMIANNTQKTNEVLDKMQKFLYFMEKRQKEWYEEYQKAKI